MAESGSGSACTEQVERLGYDMAETGMIFWVGKV